MGGAVSGPLERTRKIVVIRAYNARRKDQTVQEQFDALAKFNSDGVKVIHADDIKECIGLTSPWFDELLARVTGDVVGEVVFSSFVSFLETGSLPEAPPKPPPRARVAEPKPAYERMTEPKLSPTSVAPLNGGLEPKCSPDILDMSRASRKMNTSSLSFDLGPQEALNPNLAHRFVKDTVATPQDALYPDVFTALGFRAPTACREILPHRGTTVGLTTRASYKRAGPTRPLWRKRETVVHERIVQYTTVDADGTVQELVESEKSQNEIVHLECKETGEFAHRESAEYEQLETFNKEVVVEERGNEEYLHLKSKDDEYEHLESNMPKTKAQREEEMAAAMAAEEEALRQAAEAEAAGLEPGMAGMAGMEGMEGGPGMAGMGSPQWQQYAGQPGMSPGMHAGADGGEGYFGAEGAEGGAEWWRAGGETMNVDPGATSPVMGMADPHLGETLGGETQMGGTFCDAGAIGEDGLAAAAGGGLAPGRDAGAPRFDDDVQGEGEDGGYGFDDEGGEFTGWLKQQQASAIASPPIPPQPSPDARPSQMDPSQPSPGSAAVGLD